jgi:hypothetical protein
MAFQSITLRLPANDPSIRTVVGRKLADSICLESGPGCGLFGPCLDLPAGQCIARIVFEGHRRGFVIVDISAENGHIVLVSRVVNLGASGPEPLELLADLPRPFSACEVRLHCGPDVYANIVAVELEFNYAPLQSRLGHPFKALAAQRGYKGFAAQRSRKGSCPAEWCRSGG